jgi:hypothetical protein
MGKFALAEVMAAYEHYSRTVDGCSASGNWSPYADCFTEDVVYIEHAYGTFHGREEVRRWIVDVMAPFPHMHFRHSWTAIDEANDAVVVEIQNILDHPSEPGVEFTFPNVTRLVYGGDGLFASEEDVYNPARDAPGAVGAWLAAGGVLRAKPIPMQHVVTAPPRS